MSLESDLAKDTEDWTKASVSRFYEPRDGAINRERKVLESHGYRLVANYVQRAQSDNHINVGRTSAKLIATGGLGLVVSGRSRAKGRQYRTITYETAARVPEASPI